MKIAIGCDHTALALKETIKNYLDSRMIPYEDFGTFTSENADYPRIAELVSKAILSGQFDRGILICGTGIGMSIAANKFPGIRAAAVSEPYSAILARRHNNANVLCFGARVVAGGLATLITEGWLNASFEGERHQRRVDMITRIEQRNLLLGVENHQSSPAEPSPELPAEPTDEPPAVSADEAPDLT
jgi:ribose 5-phosphate isomerase B